MHAFARKPVRFQKHARPAIAGPPKSKQRCGSSNEAEAQVREFPSSLKRTHRETNPAEGMENKPAMFDIPFVRRNVYSVPRVRRTS